MESPQPPEVRIDTVGVQQTPDQQNSPIDTIRTNQANALRIITSAHNTETSASMEAWKRMNLIGILYFVPTTVAILVTLAIDFSKPCARPPLRTWITIQGLLQIMILMSHGSHYIRSQNLNPERRARVTSQFHFVNRFLNFFWATWFTVGVAWVFQPSMDPDSCTNTAPNIYRLCLALIIMEIAIIGLGCLLCSCAIPIVWIAYMCGWGPANANRPQTASRGLLRSKTSVKKFETDQIALEDASCVICLGDYKEGEKVRHLPCQHHFHKECIDEWLQQYSKSCPFCKADIDSKKPQSGFQAKIGKLLNLRRRSVSEPVQVLRLPIGQR